METRSRRVSVNDLHRLTKAPMVLSLAQSSAVNQSPAGAVDVVAGVQGIPEIPGISPSPTPEQAHGLLLNRVRAVLDRIRPMVQADGGDLELVEVTAQGVARIRLLGACVGCPSSSMTLKSGVELNLRRKVPGIVGVEAVP